MLLVDMLCLTHKISDKLGLFAYGHPFLDGNGRTMLVLHSELCHRAGFCIEWQRTRKTDYLAALSAEIASPGKGHLDRYLLGFIGMSRDRQLWGGVIDGIQGLNGGSVDDAVDDEYSDAHVRQKYQAFELNRSRSKAGSS